MYKELTFRNNPSACWIVDGSILRPAPAYKLRIRGHVVHGYRVYTRQGNDVYGWLDFDIIVELKTEFGLTELSLRHTKFRAKVYVDV